MWEGQRPFWLVVVLCVAGWTGLVLGFATQPADSILRVTDDGTDLWVLTYDGVFLQGAEETWWVSHDGGRSWDVSSLDPNEEPAPVHLRSCGRDACYRLVDGWRIERQVRRQRAWRVDHRRAQADAPPADGGSDWQEERSVAVVSRLRGDVVLVAAGHEGALVRAPDGTWRARHLGYSWIHPYRWRLVAIGAAGILLVAFGIDRFLAVTHGIPTEDPPWPPARPAGNGPVPPGV